MPVILTGIFFGYVPGPDLTLLETLNIYVMDTKRDNATVTAVARLIASRGGYAFHEDDFDYHYYIDERLHMYRFIVPDIRNLIAPHRVELFSVHRYPEHYVLLYYIDGDDWDSVVFRALNT